MARRPQAQTAPKITGAAIISALEKKLRSKTVTKLAADLGVSGQAIQNWKKRRSVTARQVASLVHKAQAAARSRMQVGAIRPLVEFFPIRKVPSKQEVKYELFGDRDGSDQSHPYLAGLKEELRSCYGVYVFFDSRGQAIYAGKARRQNLWREMKGTFNRERDDLQMIRRVRHPSRKLEYRTSNEKLRQIREVSVPLHELAYYFSAYEVEDVMIGVVEAMLVRSFANDLLNKRMERFGGPPKAKRKPRARR